MIRKKLKSGLKRSRLKSREKLLLLVDLSHTFRVGWHTHSELRHKGKSTAGIYGMITMLISKIRMSRATHILICEDRRPYLRNVLYPAYKGNRKVPKTKEELRLKKDMDVNMGWCKELFKDIGLPMLALDGYEADDLISGFIKLYKDKFNWIHVLSGDTDLYQNFFYADNVSFLKRSVRYSRGNFDNEFEIKDICEWSIINAMTGGHNGLEKIPGVGFITAKKICRDPERLLKIGTQYDSLIERNMELMHLPWNQQGCYDLIKEKGAIGNVLHPLYNFNRFKQISKWGISLTQGMSESLNQLRLGAL